MTSAALRQPYRRINYSDNETTPGEVIAASLVRISTDNQLGSSLDDQERRIERAVEQNEIKSLNFPNCPILYNYRFRDEAISGFGLAGRDGVSELISLVRQKIVKLILVDNVTRLIRGMSGSLIIYDLLQEFGAELIAVSDGFSSSEKGARLKFMNKAYSSEEFLENISLDTRRSLNERRLEGFSDGHLPFGYGSTATKQIQTKGRLKDSYFEYHIIPTQAELINRTFNYANSGLSQYAIARLYSLERIPTPRCYDKLGNLRTDITENSIWYGRTIFQILNNKTYIGILERNKTCEIRKGDGTKQVFKVPRSKWVVFERPDMRIVPQQLWDSVHKIYETRAILKEAVSPGKPFRYDGTCNHVLTNLCKCDVCSGSFVIASGKKDGYYGCSNAYRAKTCDNKKLIAAKKLELPILQWIIKQLEKDDICKILANEYNKLRRLTSQGNSSELETKEAKLLEIKSSIKNLLTMVEGGSTSANLIKRLADLEFEETSLAEKVKFLQGTDRAEVYMTAAAIKSRLADVPNLLLKGSPFEVHRALKPLISGPNGLRLVRCVKTDGNDGYKAIGLFKLGRVFGLTGNNLDSLSLDLPMELEL